MRVCACVCVCVCVSMGTTGVHTVGILQHEPKGQMLLCVDLFRSYNVCLATTSIIIYFIKVLVAKQHPMNRIAVLCVPHGVSHTHC